MDEQCIIDYFGKLWIFETGAVNMLRLEIKQLEETEILLAFCKPR